MLAGGLNKSVEWKIKRQCVMWMHTRVWKSICRLLPAHVCERKKSSWRAAAVHVSQGHPHPIPVHVITHAHTSSTHHVMRIICCTDAAWRGRLLRLWKEHGVGRLTRRISSVFSCTARWVDWTSPELWPGPGVTWGRGEAASVTSRRQRPVSLPTP
jgi:hypothetical protein